DTTLWVNSMEEGRARIEARVGSVRSTADLGIAEKMRNAGSEQDAWALLVGEVCRAHELTQIAVDSDFPALIVDHLRSHAVDVTPRNDLYRRERRIKNADEIEMLARVESAGMEGVQRAIDVIAAADIEDGLLTSSGT